MGSYAYETQYDAKSFSKLGLPKTEIVIHHWGIDGQTHDGVRRFFQGAKTSAHFIASAGKVTCMVAWKHTAYHAGVWNVNLRSYGIECRPEASAGDLETIAQLIADLWKHHKKKLPITYHKKYKNTACPGRYMNQLAFLETRATEIYEGRQTPTMYTIKSGDTLSGIALKHKTTVKKLMKANPLITNANKIAVGQKIFIK